jgi:peptide chain release factor subunit 1
MENEYGSASNIKDRENRQSVQQALRSTIYQLKQLKQLPPNGIVLFSGKELYV